MSSSRNLTDLLRSLLGILELDTTSNLYKDTVAICDYLDRPTYQIAVFAPFNHGKSTLLNALLGSKTLPIDLIPTTGAAISIGYGEELATEISLKDGTKRTSKGIELLQEYAILDGDRRMKEEVVEVKVYCNNTWLKTGIEFLDLPGTNDREAQNDLVKDKLLGADLIIHVLDARKLMTLEEREHLTAWLQNRGITTVIFVVNFLNLLTSEERQDVKQRLYFIAGSFRSSLPVGVSNIYCVDALPALRARLKGDRAGVHTSGITSLESALQTIVSSSDRQSNKLPRTIKISNLLLDKAKLKQQELAREITTRQNKAQQQIQVKQKAAKLIKESFDRAISDFRGYLYFPTLLKAWQPSLAIALQETRFALWLESEFKPQILARQQTVNQWIAKGAEFFDYENPQLLAIKFTEQPIIQLPESILESTNDNAQEYKSYLPKELNFLLKKKAGAIVIGGANYLIDKAVRESKARFREPNNPIPKTSSQIYIEAAKTYLQQFSDRLNLLLNEYEPTAIPYVTYLPTVNSQVDSAIGYQLQLLARLIEDLNQFNYSVRDSNNNQEES